jgi:hypothetical protein
MVNVLIVGLALSGSPLDLKAVQRNAEFAVALGFDTRAQILDDALLGATEAERPAITELVDEAFRKHFEKQKTWKGRTDCDRLSAAFAALNRARVIARENFGMTRTSSRGEMNSLLAKEPSRLGYVFITPEDLSTVFDDQGVTLIVGAAAPREDAHEAVVKTVISALQKQGLAAEWSGLTKVWVPLDWKKRRRP